MRATWRGSPVYTRSSCWRSSTTVLHPARRVRHGAKEEEEEEEQVKRTDADKTIGPYDSLFAGMMGGYFVFGRRSPRTGKISPVSQQIVIYIFARVALALASISVKPGTGFDAVSAEPLRSQISYYAWPAFASLSWGMVMLLFDKHPDDLQSSLRSSMQYIYRDCDSWDSLRTLIWHNK